MSYTHNIYKIWEEVKTKYTMRIYSLRRHRLKHEWNQTVWSANNLRCGTAAVTGHTLLELGSETCLQQVGIPLSTTHASHNEHALPDLPEGGLARELAL